jgi:hypothetical protein
MGINREEDEQVDIDVVAMKDHHHGDTGRCCRLSPWLAHACVQMMAEEGIHCLTLVALLKQILDMDPKQAQQRDTMGNLPLHHSHRATLLHVLLHVYPEGASIPNSEGRLPLHSMALSLSSSKNSKGPNLSWLQLGIETLLRANYMALATIDPVTGLFPFQLAASTGGTDVSNNTSKEVPRTTSSSEFHFDISKKRRYGYDDVANPEEREHHPSPHNTSFVDERHHMETMYRLLRKDPSLVVA